MERLRTISRPGKQPERRRRHDYSDHYRLADFQFPVEVAQADTQNFLDLNITGVAIGRVRNMWLAAFNNDNWAQWLFSNIANAVSTYTRARPATQVLAAKDDAQAVELSDRVVASGAYGETGDPLSATSSRIGVELSRFTIEDISLTNDQHATRLADEAIAEVDKRAAETRAKGHAASIKESGAALKENPEALQIALAEVAVRKVAAAGDKATIIMDETSGQGGSAMQAAMLRELRALRDERGGTGS